MPKQYCCFSEAIRDGAKLRPQAYGAHRGYASCALEAGIEAIGGEFAWSDKAQLCERFPYMRTVVTAPPFRSRISLFDACWQLNDCEKWTREQIADWLFVEEEKLGFVTLIEEKASYDDSKGLHIQASERAFAR